jgi:hypothetical protein
MQPLQAFSLPLTLEEASFKLTENVFEFIGNYLILGLVCICCVLCVRPCPSQPPPLCTSLDDVDCNTPGTSALWRCWASWLFLPPGSGSRGSSGLPVGKGGSPPQEAQLPHRPGSDAQAGGLQAVQLLVTQPGRRRRVGGEARRRGGVGPGRGSLTAAAQAGCSS